MRYKNTNALPVREGGTSDKEAHNVRKCSEIREVCGDYALDVEYAKDFTFTMFFNSRRNAETVKRCIEVDDSIPNAATAVDFVEVVRCRDCKYFKRGTIGNDIVCICVCPGGMVGITSDSYCSRGKRSAK